MILSFRSAARTTTTPYWQISLCFTVSLLQPPETNAARVLQQPYLEEINAKVAENLALENDGPYRLTSSQFRCHPKNSHGQASTSLAGKRCEDMVPIWLCFLLPQDTVAVVFGILIFMVYWFISGRDIMFLSEIFPTNYSMRLMCFEFREWHKHERIVFNIQRRSLALPFATTAINTALRENLLNPTMPYKRGATISKPPSNNPKPITCHTLFATPRTWNRHLKHQNVQDNRSRRCLSRPSS